MPVLTRSQRNNMDAVAQEEAEYYDHLNKQFITKMKEYCDKCNKYDIGKENKMRYVLKIYKLINKSFPTLIEKRPDQYITFAATTFNKSTELLIECNEGKWRDIDHKLVEETRDEIFKSRCHIMPIIRYCDEYSTNTEIIKAKIYFTHRNRRVDL